MKDILTVSQLSDSIKLLLEDAFDLVWVEGEISNLRRPQSGHTYFTLKDDKSQIRAVYFKQFGWARNRAASFEPEEGLSVLCRGRLSVYQPRGEYQLIIESLEPRGTGALQKAFEQLKAKLSAEGLFEERYKKNIPLLPGKIGVVTSPTGAVIRDILNITRRRFPSIDILIAPVRVQGAGAATEIIQGLRKLQAQNDIDVIIIARGGGSLEDIAPFNDETLARAIFASSVPIISAVGHETDFTICDFVADLRAPTPSAAAELAVPDRKEMLSRIADFEQRLINGQRRFLANYRLNLTSLQERLRDPRHILIDWKILLDDLHERLRGAWRNENRHLQAKIKTLAMNLRHLNPEDLIAAKRILLNNYQKAIMNSYDHSARAKRERLQTFLEILNSLSPLHVLQRGYSITRSRTSGAVIRDAAQLSQDETVSIKLARGDVQARVEKIFKEQ